METAEPSTLRPPGRDDSYGGRGIEAANDHVVDVVTVFVTTGLRFV